ncbi:hypothetical protein J3E68DRAFT_193531 [Trichoderma sp. SZMC 28012]
MSGLGYLALASLLGLAARPCLLRHWSGMSVNPPRGKSENGEAVGCFFCRLAMPSEISPISKYWMTQHLTLHRRERRGFDRPAAGQPTHCDHPFGSRQFPPLRWLTACTKAAALWVRPVQHPWTCIRTLL